MVFCSQVILRSLNKVVAPVAKRMLLLEAKTLEDEVAIFALEIALIDQVGRPSIIIDLCIAHCWLVCLRKLGAYPSLRVYATHR